LEILDKKGVKNVVANHLSRILNAPTEEKPINEDFPDEHILAIRNLGMLTSSITLPWDKYLLNGRSRINIASSPKYSSPFGKSRIFSSIVLTKSSDGVYQRKSTGMC